LLLLQLVRLLLLLLGLHSCRHLLLLPLLLLPAGLGTLLPPPLLLLL
jgi:hypothetical protein